MVYYKYFNIKALLWFMLFKYINFYFILGFIYILKKLIINQKINDKLQVVFVIFFNINVMFI